MKQKVLLYRKIDLGSSSYKNRIQLIFLSSQLATFTPLNFTKLVTNRHRGCDQPLTKITVSACNKYVTQLTGRVTKESWPDSQVSARKKKCHEHYFKDTQLITTNIIPQMNNSERGTQLPLKKLLTSEG